MSWWAIMRYLAVKDMKDVHSHQIIFYLSLILHFVKYAE